MDAWPRRYCADRAELVLLRRSAIASEWLGLAVGGFLASRRLMGATALSLATGPQVAITIALVAWSLWVNLVRAGSMVSEAARPAPDRRPPGWLPRSDQVAILPVMVTLLVAGACLDAGSLLDWTIWLFAAGSAVFAPQLNDIIVRSAGREVDAPASHVPSEEPTGASDRSRSVPGSYSDLLAAENDAEIDPADEDFLQRISRTRTPEGAQVIHALMAADLPPGTRSTTLFVPFCPPWETLPEVDVSVGDGPPAEAKVVQVLHHGGQIEVRLDQPSTVGERVLVELIASGDA